MLFALKFGARDILGLLVVCTLKYIMTFIVQIFVDFHKIQITARLKIFQMAGRGKSSSPRADSIIYPSAIRIDCLFLGFGQPKMINLVFIDL